MEESAAASSLLVRHCATEVGGEARRGLSHRVATAQSRGKSADTFGVRHSVITRQRIGGDLVGARAKLSSDSCRAGRRGEEGCGYFEMQGNEKWDDWEVHGAKDGGVGEMSEQCGGG